jgi:hypothetical protein
MIRLQIADTGIAVYFVNCRFDNMRLCTYLAGYLKFG